MARFPRTGWRHVGLASVLVFAVLAAVELVVTGRVGEGLYSSAIGLLVPYSLARWSATRRTAVIGLIVFAGVAGAALPLQDPRLTSGDAIGSAAAIACAAACGIVFRYRAALRRRQLEQAPQDERLRLARDFHDTAAHHLTAIAVTAQAGLAGAGTRPEAATDVRPDDYVGMTGTDSDGASAADYLRRIIRSDSSVSRHEPSFLPGRARERGILT